MRKSFQLSALAVLVITAIFTLFFKPKPARESIGPTDHSVVASTDVSEDGNLQMPADLLRGSPEDTALADLNNIREDHRAENHDHQPSNEKQKMSQSMAKTDQFQDQNLSSLIPSKKTLQKEVSENPHDTPPSLLTFSLQMSARMQDALDSETKAETLFTELEDCVLNREFSGLASVQATCLLSALRLSDRFQDNLHARYRKLSSDADPRALEIAEILAGR